MALVGKVKHAKHLRGEVRFANDLEASGMGAVMRSTGPKSKAGIKRLVASKTIHGQFIKLYIEVIFRKDNLMED